MKLSNYFVVFNNTKIVVSAFRGFEELLDNYLLTYSIVNKNFDSYDYNIALKIVKEYPSELSSNSEVVYGIGMTRYKRWIDNDIITLLYEGGNNYKGHLIIRRSKELVMYIKEGDELFANIWLLRVCREIFYRELLNDNYIAIHASCVSDINTNKAVLFFGNKGRGKSTSLLTFAKRFKFSPLSNDVVFIKKCDGKNEYNVVGFPFKVSIGNSLMSYLRLNKSYGEKKESKTFFYPKEFCDFTGTNWLWESRLGTVGFVNLSLNEKTKVCMLDQVSSYDFLISEGVQNSKWKDCLMIQKKHNNVEQLLRSVSQEVKCFNLKGDIYNISNTEIINII